MQPQTKAMQAEAQMRMRASVRVYSPLGEGECEADNRHTAVYLSLGPIGEKHVHALKGLACCKWVAAACSPAATCKQGVALTSPARHACGRARPSRARFGHRDSKILSNGSKT